MSDQGKSNDNVFSLADRKPHISGIAKCLNCGTAQEALPA